MPPIHSQVLKEVIETIEQCYREGYAPIGSKNNKGSVIAAAAARLKINPHTLLSRIKQQIILKAQGEPYSLPDDTICDRYIENNKKESPIIEEESSTQRRNRFLEIANKELNIENRRLQQENDLLLDIREGLLKLKLDNTKNSWRAAGPSVVSSSTLLPILFTSDFQCGEVIKTDQVDGMNEYNMNVFSDRYNTMIEKTIKLSKNYMGKTNYTGIYYLRGGDAISGSIHEELAETNDLSAVPAVRWLLQHEREGIKQLKKTFGRVRVYSIPGNHGRTTFKSRAKNYVDLNFETLLAWWLESSFENDPDVEFVTPKSGDAYFDCLGWKILMSHGDRMGSRGGMGFIGPTATIARGQKKLFDDYNRTGKSVDYILTGHMHTSLKLELGFSNGSLSGVSEYSIMYRMTPDSAKQWLLYLEEDLGVVEHRELILSPRPMRHVD